MNDLISVDEFKRKRAEMFAKYNREMEETNIECPICGKALYVDKTFVVSTYPARHTYYCDCGYRQTM